MSEYDVERMLTGDDVKEIRHEMQVVQDVQTEHAARFDSVDGQLRSLTQIVGQVLDRLPEDPEPTGVGQSRPSFVAA